MFQTSYFALLIKIQEFVRGFRLVDQAFTPPVRGGFWVRSHLSISTEIQYQLEAKPRADMDRGADTEVDTMTGI